MLPHSRFPGWLFLLLFSACCGGLHAQNIVVSSSELLFAAPVGGAAEPALLTVSSSGAPIVVNVAVNTFGVGHWLNATPTASGTPVSLVVTANSAGLDAGVFFGEVLISSAQAPNSPVAVPVRFTVGGAQAGALTVSPASLSFTGQPFGFPPGTQTLSVVSSPSGLSFAASVSTDSGGNWLNVSPATAIAPAGLTVSVTTAGLPAGAYTGTILITPSTGPAVSIPVTLDISTANVLSVNPSALQFFYQIGGFLPASQTFEVANAAGLPISFAVSPSSGDGLNWLSATPLFAVTPQTVTVSVSPPLVSGVYLGKVNVSAPSTSNASVDVPVTLTVSAAPLLTIGSYPSRFTYQIGRAAPPPQSIFLGSTAGALQYTASATTSSGGQWLAVAPSSSQTPQALSIAVSPGSLAPGTYSGTVTIVAPGAGNSPVSIPVTLVVSTGGELTSSLQAIHFNYQPGGQSQVVTQTVRIDSNGAPLAVTAAASTTTCGGNWLHVYTPSFTTPASATVAIEPVGFTAPVDCTGVVTFTSAGASTGLQIPVTLRVAAAPLFNFTPMWLNFTAPFDGEITAEQEISLGMTDTSAAQFTATASTITGGPWLRVTPETGATPAALRVSANPSNLSPGSYTGSILLSSAALNGSRAIPVTLRVTATFAAAATPAALTFTQVVGGAPPPAQTIGIATGGVSTPFTVTTSQGWLSANPNTGATPNTISVSINGSGLAPGTYSGAVVFVMPAAANSPLSVPVSLTIVPARMISSAVSQLSFTWRVGETAPAAQTVRVTSTGDPANIAAAVTSGAWLRVAPANATTPANFEVSVVPAGLAVGTYVGTVELAAPGIAGSPIRIPVTFSVLSAPAPSLTDLYNAASGLRGALAPGEIISIKGLGLGPDTGVELQLTPEGKVATTLAGVRVLFEDVPGPVLYASAGQINVVVPYEVAGLATVRVVVEYRGARSPAFTYQVAPVSPGLFSASSTGRGQGAILNQNGAYNSASTPAEKGSIVQVFGTGDGVSVPPLETGAVTPDLRRTSATVRALVGGFEAEVAFAGPAPAAVAGLLQANVRIPLAAPSGDVPIVLLIGGVATQSGLTVAVR